MGTASTWHFHDVDALGRAQRRIIHGMADASGRDGNLEATERRKPNTACT